MIKLIKKISLIAISLACLNACQSLSDKSITADILIQSAQVFTGEDKPGEYLDVAVCGKLICYVGPSNPLVRAPKIIDAKGLVLTPGFIDPHTHTLAELLSRDKSHNLNYLTQGVTTVINGNDGEGSANIAELSEQLENNGIGNNVALLVGHGAIRQQVMGLSNAPSNEQQLAQMKALVTQAMQEGAFGFSTGLYYVPGRYSNTQEVIELAKIAGQHGGIYDSHIRDESTFNIGFINAVKEVIEIAEKANINAHIAHIKALGVDVWGKSVEAIDIINQARDKGLRITADQYPWQASGTFLHSAVIPDWVMADSRAAFKKRLKDSELLKKIKPQISENIRRRGGANTLLITASNNPQWLGKTLQEIAQAKNISAVDVCIQIVLAEKARVASFNMSAKDIENFMLQPWVVSSSDGTNGHPRKFASYPRKYQEYVVGKKLMPLHTFINRSSAKVAEIFSIQKRGFIKSGYFADINLINLKNYQAKADFSHWNKLSTGVEHQIINGEVVISNSKNIVQNAGVVLKHH